MGEYRDDEGLVRVALDGSRVLSDRISAVRELGGADSPTVLEALVELATCSDAPAAFAAAVGRSLGQICFRRSQGLDDLVVARMSGDAYIEYDSEIAQLQKMMPWSKMRRGTVGSGR